MRLRLWAGDEAMVREAVRDAMGGPPIPATARAIALLDEDANFCGGVLFYPRANGFEAEFAAVIAAGVVMPPRIVRDLCRVAFEVLGYRRVAVRVDASDDHAIRRAEMLGFCREGVARAGLDGERDALVLAMLARDCRWVK